jgi:hypothetical protein
MHLLVVGDYVCAGYILDRQCIITYAIMSSEAPLPQYLNCRPVSRSELLEVTLFMCVSLDGTPFMFLVITVLCIATSCVLRKVHSHMHLKIFAVCDACCIS